MNYINRHIKPLILVLVTILSITTLITPSVMAASAPGSVGTWTTSPNTLPQALEFGGSITANGYVYVIGGATNAVYYAKLNSDGSIGSWTTSPNSLPQNLNRITPVVANGYVYVLGGYGSGGPTNAVYYAKLNSDGSIGSWTTSPNTLPQIRSGIVSVTANGYIYVIGGFNNINPTNTVYYAKLNSDGSIGSWTTSPNSLPQAIESSGSILGNGYVYVLGGYGSGGPTNTVYYAKLNSDGSIGSWTTSPNSLPQAAYSASSVTDNSYVYVMGGNNNSGNSINTVYYAKLNSDGSIGSWTTSPNSLPQAISGTSSVATNNYVYVMGGANNLAALQQTVYYATLTPNPTPAPATTSTANSLTLTTSTTTPKAPDTGYGTPGTINSINISLMVISTLTISTGLFLIYRQQKSKA